jgi:glycine hydroxymethyltransferase
MAEMASFGAAYAEACLVNAQALASALARAGLEPLFADRGYTRSHMFVVPYGSHDEAQEYAERCEAADLIVSVTQLPAAREALPTFGIRIGVQDLTRRGLGPDDMAEIAELMGRLHTDHSAEAIEGVKVRMNALAEASRTVYYCFENGLPGSVAQ